METLFTTLQKKIAQKIPEAQLIDEDYGQLQALLNGEDSYPVTFPCVLIGDIGVSWKDAIPTIQQGEGTLTVRLAFDCYDDTYYGSGTEDKVSERIRLSKRLYAQFQGHVSRKGMGRLKRIKSADYALPGGIKVYEAIYSFDIVDDSAAQAQ